MRKPGIILAPSPWPHRKHRNFQFFNVKTSLDALFTRKLSAESDFQLLFFEIRGKNIPCQKFAVLANNFMNFIRKTDITRVFSLWTHNKHRYFQFFKVKTTLDVFAAFLLDN